ncbi:flagellar basal body-associated FliL family protein [Clostridium estertheticum]|uniref:flagellar basal body-associated FliL family protein n=1 Tax=Clostridium estertheticum TaxID=238834 RepID=UPI0013E9415A|nr:flagellar basal body-associated FliL family protein [Clostridium estertheticum]MBN4049321.1 flagellar basal body-associated FliL family protein [bacterium AH-315-N14]MBZ9688070.1 flagellar basal body-associated FliL family protein [Clostridium estertheticum]
MSDNAKKGNVLKIVIIVLLILVVVGGAAFGGMYFASKKSGTATANTAKVVETNEVTYSLDEFLLNLMDEDGKRYLKVKVFIGYEDNKALTAELEAKKPIIRDVVIATLRAKRTTDFSATGIDSIKNQLIASINPVLTKGKIAHIYFNDILVQ